MSVSKFYVSGKNFKVGPGNKKFTKGEPFSRDQWMAAGGKETALDKHIERKYIKEWVQEVPKSVQIVQAQKAIEDQQRAAKAAAMVKAATVTIEADAKVTDIPQEAPAEAPAEVPAEVPAEAPAEVPAEVPVKAEASSTKPAGIWNFSREYVDGLELDDLNAVYLGVANKHGITARAYQNLESLRTKMTSEA